MRAKQRAGRGDTRMSFRFGQALGTLALSLLCWSAQARDIRVAVVTDGPVVRQKLTVEVLEREVANVAGAGLRILLPPEKRFAGDYSLEGAAAAFERALADRD